MKNFILHTSQFIRNIRINLLVILISLITTTTFGQNCEYCPNEFSGNNLNILTTKKEIIKITPNPASDFITIDYKVLNTNSAHIRLLKIDNSIDRIYPLDLQNTQKTINVTDCNFGSYVLMLVCDGVNEDSDIVIIQ